MVLADFGRVVAAVWILTLPAGQPPRPALAPTPVVHTLGVVRLSIQLPPTWKATDLKKAKANLERDGVTEPAVFAFEGRSGGLIYGTWKVLPPGMSFTADSIAAMMDDPALEKWGIKPADTRSLAETQAKGLRFAYLRARGLGNGQEFSPKLKVPTVGIWVDIPVAFKDGAGNGMGLASLFYRSSAAEALAGGEALFHDVIDALEPTAAVIPLSAFADTQSNPMLTDAPSAANAPATTSATAALAAWPDALPTGAGTVIAWPTDRTSYQAGLAEVDRLIALFPANAWLANLRMNWLTSRRERAQISEWLASDADGLRRRDLTTFHERALAEIAGAESPKELLEYLAYVTLVWPGNPFVRPPAGPGTGDEWKHWPTGQTFKRSQVPGGVFWHTVTPVCHLPGFSTTGLPAGLRFPLPGEYEVLWKQGTMNQQARSAWVAAVTGADGQAVPMEFDRDRLVRLKKRDLPLQCYAVLTLQSP